jgi:hypothetical protein
MQKLKTEGAAFPPVFLGSRRAPRAMERCAAALPHPGALCQMCGVPVASSRCPEICLSCGFLAVSPGDF